VYLQPKTRDLTVVLALGGSGIRNTVVLVSAFPALLATVEYYCQHI